MEKGFVVGEGTRRKGSETMKGFREEFRSRASGAAIT